MMYQLFLDENACPIIVNLILENATYKELWLLNLYLKASRETVS